MTHDSRRHLGQWNSFSSWILNTAMIQVLIILNLPQVGLPLTYIGLFLVYQVLWLLSRQKYGTSEERNVGIDSRNEDHRSQKPLTS